VSTWGFAHGLSSSSGLPHNHWAVCGPRQTEPKVRAPVVHSGSTQARLVVARRSTQTM
jgi:hypothetical protein